MQIEYLETFVAVARHGTLTRTAEVLYLTQSAVTNRLQALQAELGEQVLARGPRGMRLTPAGREFLEHAERAVAAYRQGRATLARLRAAQAGHLVLGAAPAVSTYYLPQMLKHFVALHPGVHFSVRTGHSEEILALVLEEQVQLGLIRQLQSPEVETHPCYEDELALYVHAAHPFRARGVVALNDVAREELVLFDRSSSYYDLTRTLFLDRGTVPSAVMELDNIEAAKKMVELGMGVALLPRVAVAREVAMGIIVPVRIADAPTLHRPVVVVHRRDTPPGETARAFLDLVQQRRTEPATAEA